MEQLIQREKDKFINKYPGFSEEDMGLILPFLESSLREAWAKSYAKGRFDAYPEGADDREHNLLSKLEKCIPEEKPLTYSSDNLARRDENLRWVGFNDCRETLITNLKANGLWKE